MNATRKVKLKDITSNLTCQLCLGYFIDATTIIECLHSFCKSCIVKHLEKSENFCPVCDVQLPTKPLSSIRSDQMLQEIVYKLVPGLFRTEMSRRREFYEQHPESSSTSQMDSGQVFNELYITSDDIIHLSLQYFTDDPTFKDDTTRYLKCPAAVSISILKKLVQGKFDLSNDVEIDVMYGERILPDEFLLMDIAYKYSWTSNGSKPLQLSYRVKGISPPIGSNLKSNKLSTPSSTKTPSSLQVKRRSRASIDSDLARSEILKSSNRNLPIESQISPITPKLTPNGKVRGRRKRSLAEDGIGVKTPVENKRKKAGKNTPVKDCKEMESQSEPTMSKKSLETANGIEKEVQLRISENGVISATSVFSGEEKIINLLKTPPKFNGASTASDQPEFPTSLPTKNNNNEKSTNPLEEATANTNSNSVPSNPMHPLLISNSLGMSSRPNYVKLNIPIVTTTTTSITSPTNSNASPIIKQLPNGNMNGSPSAKIPASSSSSTPPKLTAVKRKLLDKVLSGCSSKIPNGSNGAVANPKEFEDKQANVKKALIDLEKKLYTTISKGSLSKLPGMLGISSSNNNNNNNKDESTSGHSTGINGGYNLPTSQPHLNGTHLQNAFSFPLSFGSSGMTVNLISSTTTNCPSAMGSITSPISSSPPQKKLAHQATVVNGDLKFTPTPRHILPSPSKEVKPPGGSVLSPKKPPKFFKSRHSSSNFSGTTPTSSDSESPVKKESNVAKIINGNGNISHNFSFGTTPTASKSSSCSIGANTITTPSGIGNTHVQNQRLQSQISNTFNPMNLQLNQLQMSLAVAAAASSPNNLPMNLVPFVTSNYCSMPFLNSRSPFNMNMNLNLASHLPNFPFSYPGMNSPTFTQSQPYSPRTTLNGNINGQHYFSVPSSPKGPSSSEEIKNGPQFLDLSMNKSNGKHSRTSNNSSPPQDEPLSLKKYISPKTLIPSESPKKIEKSSNKVETSTSQTNGPISLVTNFSKQNSALSEAKENGNDTKESINDCSINGKEINGSVNEIKSSLESKTDNFKIQSKSNGTVPNINNIGESSNDTTARISNTAKSEETTPTKKLQNGHPDFASTAPAQNNNEEEEDCRKSPSSKESLTSEFSVHLQKEDLLTKVNQEAPEIVVPERQQKLPNGDHLNGNSVLESPKNMSKNQIPSCNNNNNNGSPQTSSTTGA